MEVPADPRQLVRRIRQLQSETVADPAPLTCRATLSHGVRVVARDAELRALLAELGATLVDALLAGRATELLATLETGPGEVAPPPARLVGTQGAQAAPATPTVLAAPVTPTVLAAPATPTAPTAPAMPTAPTVPTEETGSRLAPRWRIAPPTPARAAAPAAPQPPTAAPLTAAAAPASPAAPPTTTAAPPTTTAAPPTTTAAPPTVVPAQPPAPAPTPEPVTVTPDVLARLQRQIVKNGLLRETWEVEQTAALRQQQHEQLGRLIEALGPTPEQLTLPRAIEQEVARLDQVIAAPPHHWAKLGIEANHALTSWATTRARAVQERVKALGLKTAADRLEPLFSRLSRHSALTQPGTVHGLARRHESASSDWLADARAHERRLRRLLGGQGGPEREPPPPPPPPVKNHDDALRRLAEQVRGGMSGGEFAAQVSELLTAGLSCNETRLVRLARPFLAELEALEFAGLRRAVERELEAEADRGTEGSPVPADWPWFVHTRGKRGVVVGGEPRPERRQRLQEAFGFASLEWMANPTRGMRRAHSLTQQMRSGSVDLVIVLRAFISHKVSDKLFAAEVPGCRTIQADSYGVTQVRLGFERFFGAAGADAAGSGTSGATQGAGYGAGAAQPQASA